MDYYDSNYVNSTNFTFFLYRQPELTARKYNTLVRSVFSIALVFGSVFLALLILSKRELRTKPRLWIVLNGLCPLFTMGVMVHPLHILTNEAWRFCMEACQMFYYVNNYCTLANPLTLAALSMNILLATCNHGVWETTTGKVITIFLICAMTAVAAVCAGVVTFGIGMFYITAYNGEPECYIEYNTMQARGIYDIFYKGLPLLLNIILALVLACVVCCCRCCSKRQENVEQGEGKSSRDDTKTQDTAEETEAASRRDSLLMVLVPVTLYVLMVTPLYVLVVLMNHLNYPPYNVVHVLDYVMEAFWALLPYLWMVVIPELRASVGSLCSGGCRRRRQGQEGFQLLSRY